MSKGGSSQISVKVKKYIHERLKEKASNGTINRELAALKRIFSLGAQDTPPKVYRVPHIPMLEENNIRKGFFEHDEYLALIRVLPSDLRPVVTFAYRTGWRKSEIIGLTWDRIDLKERTASLAPGETKNDEGRTIYLDDELLKLVKFQNLRRDRDVNYVFH